MKMFVTKVLVIVIVLITFTAGISGEQIDCKTIDGNKFKGM